jgi:hypothetical protein
VDSVSGVVASTPVIAAMRSVWRTFFNIVPFAGARAEVKPSDMGFVPVFRRVATSSRAVSIRHDSKGELPIRV